MSNIDLINKLHQEGALDFDEFKRLLKTFDQNGILITLRRLLRKSLNKYLKIRSIFGD